MFEKANENENEDDDERRNEINDDAHRSPVQVRLAFDVENSFL